MKTTTKKQKQHYVDNQEFLAAIIKYKERVYNAAVKEIPGLADMDSDEQFTTLKTWKSPNKPRVGNYIGSCFLKIATHLSYRPNFNPAKSKNPFAYFTQIVYYAFLRRIAKEKRQLDIKDKILEKSGYDHVFTVDGDTDSGYNQIKSRVEMNSKR